MLKKIGIVVFALILISILVKFFTIDTTPAVKVSDLIKYIPQSAAIIVETGNIQRIIEELLDEDNELWLYLNEINEFSYFNEELIFLDSIFNANENLVPLLSNNLSEISFHFVGKKEPEALYLMAKPQNLKNKEIDVLLQEIFSKHAIISTKEYENTEITIFQLNSNENKKFYLYKEEKVILFSSSEILIEESVRKKDESNNFLKDKIFNGLYKAVNKKALANVFINFQNFPDIISTFSSKSVSLKTTETFAQWMAFNLIIEDNAFIFNGLSNSKSDEINYLSLFENQKPQKSSIIEILPENTTSFISVCFSDILELNNQQIKQLKEHSLLSSYNKKNARLKEQTGLNFEFLYNNYIDNEILLLYTNENEVEEPSIIAKINDETELEHELNLALDSLSKFKSSNSEGNKTTIVINEEESVDILHLNIKNPLSTLYGNIFRSKKLKYYAIFKEYLLIASSAEKIENIITSYGKNKLFINKKEYKEITKIANKKHTILVYSNPVSSKKLYYYILNRKYANKVKLNEKKLNKLNAFTLAFSPNENGLYHVNFSLIYNKEKKPTVEKKWKIRLDTSMTRKPQLFKNHYNGSREIFTQDENNNIYLIDRTGKVLFKRHIKYKIVGEAKQIDYYTNTKLQMLFTAGNQLFLIDRNGENVEHFPIKLPAKASSTVSVFDYDNNKDYRFFISTTNKKTYTFNRDGKLLDSWNFKSKNLVKEPVKHVRIETKDYIVISAKEKLYIQNRKGEERLKLNKNVQLSDGAEIYFMNGENPHLVSSTKEGLLVKIYFNGNVVTEKLADIPPKHFFLLADLDNDRKYELIFSYDKKVVLFNSEYQKIKEYEFKEEITSRPSVFSFENEQKMLGIHSKAANEIYLLSSNLKLHEMFPLFGNSPFVISYPEHSDSGLKYSLITGSENLGLINYQIEE